MIQLQYGTTSSLENVAFWSNQYFTGSTLLFSLTSSFAGPESSPTVYVIQNNTNLTENNGWILFNVSGSDVPPNSRHYTSNIYNRVTGSAVVWETATDIWNTIQQQWDEYSAAESAGGLLATERVFVTGSDWDEQYKYQNNELAFYNVYNG